MSGKVFIHNRPFCATARSKRSAKLETGSEGAALQQHLRNHSTRCGLSFREPQFHIILQQPRAHSAATSSNVVPLFSCCSDLLLRRFLHIGGGDYEGGVGYNACANRRILRVHTAKTILFVLAFLRYSRGELGVVSRRRPLESRVIRPVCASEEDAALTTPDETLKARLCATFRHWELYKPISARS